MLATMDLHWNLHSERFCSRLVIFPAAFLYKGRAGQALALGQRGLGPPWPWATLALGRSRTGPVGLAMVFMRSDYLHTFSIGLVSLAWDLLLESVGSFTFGSDRYPQLLTAHLRPLALH